MTDTHGAPAESSGSPDDSCAGRGEVSDAVRVQILATEHWSLLATRSLTWNEIFSRVTMFMAVLSAFVVAMALVADASGFGIEFLAFAAVVLSVALLLGLLTFIRLGQLNFDDIGHVAAMNRLRHGYLSIAPDVERYFTSRSHDDIASVLHSYGSGLNRRIGRFVGGVPGIVGILNTVIAGVLAALLGHALSLTTSGVTALVVPAAIAAALTQALITFRSQQHHRATFHSRFPRDGDPAGDDTQPSPGVSTPRDSS